MRPCSLPETPHTFGEGLYSQILKVLKLKWAKLGFTVLNNGIQLKATPFEFCFIVCLFICSRALFWNILKTRTTTWNLPGPSEPAIYLKSAIYP